MRWRRTFATGIRSQSAAWSIDARRWQLEVIRLSSDGQSELVQFTASFLWMCQGLGQFSR